MAHFINDVNNLHPSCPQSAEAATDTPMEVGDDLGAEVVRERDRVQSGRDRALRHNRGREDRGARRDRGDRQYRGQGRWEGRRQRERDQRQRRHGPRRN